jgi:hypothetical protein
VEIKRYCTCCDLTVGVIEDGDFARLGLQDGRLSLGITILWASIVYFLQKGKYLRRIRMIRIRELFQTGRVILI